MAGKDGKTERATPRRREEARKEGQVAKSVEVAVAVSLVVALVTLRTLMPVTMRVFAEQSRIMFSIISTGELQTGVVGSSVLTLFVAGVVPFLAVALVAGLAANVAQVGLKVTTKAAQPKLSRLSPKRGLERLKPSIAGWEFVKTATKLVLLGVVVAGPLTDLIDRIGEPRGLLSGMEFTTAAIFAILARGAALMAVIAAADWGFNKYKHEQRLKMSKQEIKEEAKMSEGDPHMKRVRRMRARELSRNRMLSAVAGADVVVTNPTHFAVAIEYSQAGGAPKVVAKGTNALAEKIKKEARRHGVMVIENKPLARALFRRVKLDQYVPQELYEAVAIVLATVYRRRASLRRKLNDLVAA